MIRFLLSPINADPKWIGLLGSIAGWAAVDFVKSAQFFAALLAGLVSLCTLILVAPKALKEIRRWLGLGRSKG